MMNEMQIFNNEEFGEVRTVVIDGEPWFVGKDVANALGYKDTVSATRKNVEEEDKGVCPVGTPSGIQQMTIINESGLYSLIFGSKLPSAKKFKRWVTSEVLPSLRKTGGYKAPQTIPEQIQLLAQGNVELNKRVDTLTDRMNKIEMDLPILPIEADRITTAARQKGTSVLGGKGSRAYSDRIVRQRVYSTLYGNLKYNFGVRSYKSIKRNQCDKAIEIIRKWEPPVFLAEEIYNLNN